MEPITRINSSSLLTTASIILVVSPFIYNDLNHQTENAERNSFSISSYTIADDQNISRSLHEISPSVFTDQDFKNSLVKLATNLSENTKNIDKDIAEILNKRFLDLF